MQVYSGSLGETSTAAEILKQKFDRIPLSPEYARILGKPAFGVKIIVYGLPFHGKTVWLLKLANYLAENVGKVLYIAHEEYGRASLADKIEKFKITSPNLTYAGSIPTEGLDPYEFVFFDSSSDMKLSIEDFKLLQAQYPGKSMILVLQTTKQGDFRGGKDWEHEADILLEVYEYQPIVYKNRYASETSTLFTAARKEVLKDDKRYMDVLIKDKRLLDAEDWLKKNPPPKGWIAGRYAWAIEKMP